MIGDLGIEPQPAEWSRRAVVPRRLSWHSVWQPKRGKWSISPASAMRAPKLIELLNSKVSLRLKPVLYGTMERRARHEAALQRNLAILKRHDLAALAKAIDEGEE